MNILKRFILWVLILLLPFILVVILGHSYKNQLLKYVVHELNRNPAQHIEVSAVDIDIWTHVPHIALLLEDFRIMDTLSNPNAQVPIQVDQLRCAFSISHLLMGKLEIVAISSKGAKLHLVKAADGTINYNFLTHPLHRNFKSELEFSIRRMVFRNSSFVFEDYIQNKKIELEILYLKNKLYRDGDLTTARCFGKIHSKGLLFNAKNGAFLKNKLIDINTEIIFTKNSPLVKVRDCELLINKETIIANATIYTEQNPRIAMELKASKVDYKNILNLLSNNLERKLSAYNISGEMQASAKIYALFKPHTLPHVDIQFSTPNGRVALPQQDIIFNNGNLVGHFTNHYLDFLPNNEENSALTFQITNANLRQIRLFGSITIYNLVTPMLDCHISTQGALRELIQLTGKDFPFIKSGTAQANITYKGLLSHAIKPHLQNPSEHFGGNIQFKDICLYLPKQAIQWDSINGLITLDKGNFIVSDLSTNTLKNQFQISGQLVHATDYFFHGAQRLQAIIQLKGKRLDITPKVLSAIDVRRQLNTSSKHSISKVLQELQAQLSISVNQVTYHALVGKSLSVELQHDQGLSTLKSLFMKLGNGTIRASGTIRDSMEFKQLGASVVLSNISLKEVFKATDNLNQESLTEQHLNGNLNANVNAKVLLTKDYSWLSQSQKTSIDFNITQGQLVNFEPLSSLSIFVFRKKDFRNVLFAPISNRISLLGDSIDIPRMKVNSSVLSFYLEGHYSLKEYPQIKIEVPLRNLNNKDLSEDASKEQLEDDHNSTMLHFKTIQKNGKVKLVRDQDRRKQLKEARKLRRAKKILFRQQLNNQAKLITPNP